MIHIIEFENEKDNPSAGLCSLIVKGTIHTQWMKAGVEPCGMCWLAAESLARKAGVLSRSAEGWSCRIYLAVTKVEAVSAFNLFEMFISFFIYLKSRAWEGEGSGMERDRRKRRYLLPAALLPQNLQQVGAGLGRSHDSGIPSCSLK